MPIRHLPFPTKSQVIVRELQSENIAHNKAGTDPLRKMLIYLPAGYDESSSQRYPVIYFLPNPFEDSYRFDFDHRDAQGLFDRAVAEGVIKKFILVAVDMNAPLGTSWYVNSSATGNWEDFMIQELVPYVDANFKTLPNRDSRGIAGIFIGGYGAIRFGMRHPDVFGSCVRNASGGDWDRCQSQCGNTQMGYFGQCQIHG